MQFSGLGTVPVMRTQAWLPSRALVLTASLCFTRALSAGDEPQNLCVALKGTTVAVDTYRLLRSDWQRVRGRLKAAGRLPPKHDRRAYWTAGGNELERVAAHRMVDDDPRTYWYAGRRKAAVTITFPSATTVSQSVWIHSSAIPAGRLDERGLKDYDISTSADGTTWEPACSVRKYLGGRKHDTFPPRRARKVRLEILQSQGFLLPVLVEWQLYGSPKPIPGDEAKWATGTRTSASTPEPPRALTVELTANKLLYRPGEDVRLEVALASSERRGRQLRVELLHRRGVEERRELARWHIDLKAGATARLAHTIANVRAEYGHHVLAAIYEGERAILSTDCVFEVAENWAKIARMVNDIAWDKLVPGLPPDEITKVHIPLWRKLYINSVEFQGNYLLYSRHYTDEDRWDFPNPFDKNNTMSAATIQRWTQAGRENGIRICTYSESGALSPELEFDRYHPDWLIQGPIAFPPATASLHSMWMYFGHRLPQAFPAGEPVVAPDLHMFDYGDLHAMTEYLADDVARAAERFGWEGAMFDSFPWALEAAAYGSDHNGSRLHNRSADDVGLHLLKRIREEVRKRTGRDFVVVANFGAPQGLSPWHEKTCDFRDFREHRAAYRKTASQMGVFMLEQHPTPNIWRSKDPLGRFIYPQTIEETVQALRLIREANDIGVPVTLHPCQYNRGKNRSVVDANVLYSCAYANGVLLHRGLGTPPRSLLEAPLSSDPVLATEARYNKFAARYGEYLFDLRIRWLPRGQVRCVAPDNVWWEELVSHRTHASGTMDIYVHLINRPAVPLLWGKVMESPQPLSNIAVSIKAQAGKRLVAVWCLSPNGDHDPRRLDIGHEGGSARLTVPELTYWTVLVCRYEPVAQSEF